MWKVIFFATCALFAVGAAETAAGYKKKLGMHSLLYTDYDYYNALDAEFVKSPHFKMAYRLFDFVMFEKMIVLTMATHKQQTVLRRVLPYIFLNNPHLSPEDLVVPLEDLDTNSDSSCIIRLKDENACGEDRKRKREREAARLAALRPPDYRGVCMSSEDPIVQNFTHGFTDFFDSKICID